MTSVRLVFKKYPFLLSGILIFLVCLLAYGQIAKMYFYLEDYLILYSVQHPSSPEAGYGSGVFGRPYGYAVTPFIPFYYLFGLEPEGYYIVEIFLYFLAALTVYFCAKTLTKTKLVALGSALIFASGYVGSSSLYRLAVGWQNILATIFLTLTVTFYYKYVKSPHRKLYFLALIFYLFTSEFSFYRAHGIILLILGIEVLFNFKLWRSVLRMVPFILSYWYFYIFSINSFIDQDSKFASFMNKVFAKDNLQYPLSFLKTLENIFIPDKFNVPLLFFICSLLGILIWKKSKILIFCLVFIIANFLVYFYNAPEDIQETTHRYLTVSFVGASIFFGVFLNKVFKGTYKYLFFCLLIVILNLSLVRREQANILTNRSQPTREFWRSFQSQVHILPKHSAIFIDSRRDRVSKPARDAALGAGSMSATTSFAVYYGLEWEDIYLAENFSELLNLVKTGKVNQDNIYTFYYSRQDGLVNTTQKIKSALFGNSSLINIGDLNNINLPFYSPGLLKFTSDIETHFSDKNYTGDNGSELSKYFSFITSRNHYWDKVLATATSEVKDGAIKNITDRNEQSSWKGDDLDWSKKHSEEVVLNLGENRQIGAVRMVPAFLARVPTKYQYECSIDGMNWRKLDSFEKKISNIEPFIDEFKEMNCVFVKLIIYKTVSDNPPQISEIEVLEGKFADLNVSYAEAIEEDPFQHTQSLSDRQMVIEYFRENGIIGKICIHDNKYESPPQYCKKHKFRLGVDNNGKFFIDQGGTVLEKIEFLLPSQLKLSIKNATLENLNFDQLKSN